MAIDDVVRQYKRPGGPIKGKPLQGKDGRWYTAAGEEMEFDPKDVEYSDRYWGDPGDPKARCNTPGLRETMMKIIEYNAANRGEIGSFVDPSGITEKDKEKLSAYRVLARQMGYVVGKYKFNADAYTAVAPIKEADNGQ